MPKKFENVTLVFKGQDFAFGLTCLYCKRVEVEHKSYAQYPRATWITYRQPRQRKDRRMVLFYDQHLAVVEGQATFDNFGPVKGTGDVTSREGKYSAGDSAWDKELDALADSHGDRVLYRQTRKGLVVKSADLDACKYVVGTEVWMGSVQGTVEIVDVLRPSSWYGVRLENGNFGWYDASVLKPREVSAIGRETMARRGAPRVGQFALDFGED